MTFNQAKWDIRFLGIAKREVAKWSKDPEAKVGCVIVSPDRRQVAMGYNGFPAGLSDDQARLDDKGLKLQYMVHAELNAILNARTNLTGWTLYVTKSPCVECAKAIIQAGIGRVVCPPIGSTSNWRPEQALAQNMLMRAGVDGSSIMTEKFE